MEFQRQYIFDSEAYFADIIELSDSIIQNNQQYIFVYDKNFTNIARIGQPYSYDKYCFPTGCLLSVCEKYIFVYKSKKMSLLDRFTGFKVKEFDIDLSYCLFKIMDDLNILTLNKKDKIIRSYSTSGELKDSIQIEVIENISSWFVTSEGGILVDDTIAQTVYLNYI